VDKELILNNLDKFFGELLELLKSTANFTLEQAPLVFKEIIIYDGIIKNGLGVLFGLFGIYCVLAFPRVLSDALKYCDSGECKGEICVPKVIRTVLTGVLGIAGFIVGICSLLTLLKAIFAPRLYLIDYVTNLLKGGGCG